MYVTKTAISKVANRIKVFKFCLLKRVRENMKLK
jgi:hypothetical protein